MDILQLMKMEVPEMDLILLSYGLLIVGSYQTAYLFVETRILKWIQI